MLWIRFSIGLFCILLGGTWFAQGIDVLGGSFMSGEFIWAIIGALVVLAGIFLIATALRQKPTPTE
jgi:uncharacterized membrane protein HdeD (DUF308 family)